MSTHKPYRQFHWEIENASAFLRDDEGKLLPFVETIAVGCLYVGMHGIPNKRAAVEYYWRALALCMTGERWLDSIALSHIQRCVGLTTSARPLTRPRFLATVRRALEAQVDAMTTRFGGCEFDVIKETAAFQSRAFT